MSSFFVAVLKLGVVIGRYSFFLSDSMRISRSLRLSPRTICDIVPLVGEQNTISGFFLSAITGVPALTASPSLTSSLGFNNLKSVGFTARIFEEMVFVIWFKALPFNGMFKPLRNRIWFDIIMKNFAAKIHNICNFVSNEHRNIFYI